MFQPADFANSRRSKHVCVRHVQVVLVKTKRRVNKLWHCRDSHNNHIRSPPQPSRIRTIFSVAVWLNQESHFLTYHVHYELTTALKQRQVQIKHSLGIMQFTAATQPNQMCHQPHIADILRPFAWHARLMRWHDINALRPHRQIGLICSCLKRLEQTQLQILRQKDLDQGPFRCSKTLGTLGQGV